jgi:hypothetical protein
VTEPVPAVAPPPAGSFGKGIAVAVAAAVVGAIAGAVITVSTNHRIGIVPVGIGFLVGLAIERFGGGDRRLPIAGAVIAVFGCLLGDLFADAHILGGDPGFSGTFDALGHPHALWSFYTDAFRLFDALFYAIAAWAGFSFGQRGLRRAQAAAAAQQPPSIEVTGPSTSGLGDPAGSPAPLGSANVETTSGPTAPGEPPAAP